MKTSHLARVDDLGSPDVLLRFPPSTEASAFMWAHLVAHLPVSLAVRELIRLRALLEIKAFEKPILDVGCGDGLFWENLIRDHALGGRELSGLIGIDINDNELALASIRLKDRGGFVLNHDISSTVELNSPARLRNAFKTVIANCSLEHVPKLEPALSNIRDYLQDEGRFILFVPAPYWTQNLALRRFFDRISPRLGGLIGGCFDGFFQHRHMYPGSVWKFLLEGLGFEVEAIYGLGSWHANSLFERFLPTAFMAFVYKAIFKKYPRWLSRRRAPRASAAFVSDIEQGAILHDDLEAPEVIEYFIVCRRSRSK